MQPQLTAAAGAAAAAPCSGAAAESAAPAAPPAAGAPPGKDAAGSDSDDSDAEGVGFDCYTQSAAAMARISAALSQHAPSPEEMQRIMRLEAERAMAQEAAAHAPADAAMEECEAPAEVEAAAGAPKVKLGDYLPEEICAVYRSKGLTKDLYAWQVRLLRCIPRAAAVLHSRRHAVSGHQRCRCTRRRGLACLVTLRWWLRVLAGGVPVPAGGAAGPQPGLLRSHQRREVPGCGGPHAAPPPHHWPPSHARPSLRRALCGCAHRLLPMLHAGAHDMSAAACCSKCRPLHRLCP
jgi:hypothetical protein